MMLCLLAFFALDGGSMAGVLKDPACFRDVETAYATLWLGALKHGASDSRTAAAVGARLLRDGKEDDAVSWFGKAIRDDADDLETLLIIGCAYQRAGMHEKAESHFQRVLKMGVKDHDDGPLVQMAWMFSDFGLLERSHQAITAAMEADPRDYDNLLEWAAILYRNQQAEEALAAMQEALSHKKDTERLLVKACQILSGDFRSFYTIRPVGSFPPVQAVPWVAPVLSEGLRGQAIQLAERLFAGSPARKTAAQAGAAMAALGVWERAGFFLKRAEETGKKEPETLSIIAQACFRQGQVDKANSFVDRALGRMRGKSWNPGIGWLSVQLKRDKDFDPMLVGLEFSTPTGQTDYLQLAAMHVECGNTQYGLEMMRRYIIKDHNEEELYLMGLEILEGVYRKAEI